MNKLKQELKNLDDIQLKERADSFRHELFSLKVNLLTGHVKDYSQFKKLRKNLARALTYLRNKNRQI